MKKKIAVAVLAALALVVAASPAAGGSRPQPNPFTEF